ncbi:MAG: STAS domain-containing protein [Pseudomonadales bacterium]
MLEHREIGSILVCRLSGRLDGNTADPVAAALQPLLDGAGRQVLLNLETLDYISSIGLRVLVKAAKAVKSGGGVLKLCSASPTVRKVLEISGMDQLLDLRDSEATALAAFSGR